MPFCTVIIKQKFLKIVRPNMERLINGSRGYEQKNNFPKNTGEFNGYYLMSL